MRINELIVESEQLDELSLAGVGKGVGNVIRGTSSAIQGAKGAWQGTKDAWNQGKQSGTYDRARAAVAGTPPTQQQPAPAQQGQAAPQPAATTTQAAPAQAAPQQATAAPTGQQGTSAPAAAPTAAAAAAPVQSAPAATTKPARVGVPAGKQAVDQAVQTVKSVRGDRRPQVVQYAQQQFANVKEHAVFHSKFLNMDI